MDYIIFKNSIMIPDQSAWQHVEFTMTQPNPIDVFGFLNQQQITVLIPAEAKNELGFQIYKPNLFSGTSSIASNQSVSGTSVTSDDSYVFSDTNGSLTPTCLQPKGFKVNIIESNDLIISNTFGGQQLPLWENTPMMQKLLKNKRSTVDPANIRLARFLRNEGKNIFVFLNDQTQIKQLEIEGIKYLRPDKLFTWMCKEKYIDPRKGGWNFKKRKKHDKAWVKPGVIFRDILSFVLIILISI